MASPSYVRATSFLSNGAPLSTPSTSLRHCSRVAAGNSAAKGSSSGAEVMTTNCHGANDGPTAIAWWVGAPGRGESRIAGSRHRTGRRHCDRGGSFTTPAGVNPGQRIGHAHACDHLFRRNLRERDQHESALEQTRMGQRELRLFQSHIIVGEQVDIDRARTPAPLLGTVAPERALHRLRTGQERMRREVRFNRDAEIDERGLLLDSPGRRVIVRGAGEKTHTAVTERGDRAIEGGAHVADIAAERDERFSHDVPVPASVSVGGTRSPGRARSSHQLAAMLLAGASNPPH